MITPTTTMAMRPAWRAASNRSLASCLKRNQCACLSASAGRSRMHEDEREARDKFLGHFQSEGSFRESTAYSLSFAGDSLERDFESDDFVSLIDDRMKRQLHKSYNSLLSPSDYDAQQLRSKLPPQLNLNGTEALANTNVKRKLPPLEDDAEGEDVVSADYHARQPLPKTINDVSSSKLDEDVRPIVITETKNPYRIVAVNSAWEQLCGYDREESQGCTLGSLLQGPETDMSSAHGLLSKLLAGEEASTTLTNYTKHGRKFLNNVRVRPIVDEMGKTVNFVGVLRELKVGEETFGNTGSDGKLLPFMA